MSLTFNMDRVRAIQLLGKQMEEDVYKNTTLNNYAFVVRKVYCGSTSKMPLKFRDPKRKRYTRLRRET